MSVMDGKETYFDIISFAQNSQVDTPSPSLEIVMADVSLKTLYNHTL
jgi:hypothetical protein